MGAKNWSQTCSFFKHIISTIASITHILYIVLKILDFVQSTCNIGRYI